MTSKIVYQGKLRTSATHLRSESVIETDAPVDNNGKGERFSPTDLVATGLGTCMITTMGIAARDKNLVLDGTTINVEKIMGAQPRRITEIRVTLDFQVEGTVSEADRSHLEHIALNCPVAKSIHPDIKQLVVFNW